MASRKLIRKSRKDDDEISAYFESFQDLSLSRINGEINKMPKTMMIQLLRKNGLNTKGVKEVLTRRLKNFYLKQRTDHSKSTAKSQQYMHFVVIDFEATCERISKPGYIHEIIEFPAVLMDAESGEFIDEFQSYCRPTLNPNLSNFCTSLTGISQEDVDGAPEFPSVLEKFEDWLKERNLLSRRNVAFITDGPWDFSRFLNIQCAVSDLRYPKWSRKWINLKKVYGNFYKINRPKLEVMLFNLGLHFEGRLHCGMDDTKNIAKVVARLIEDGCMLQVNERLNDGKLESISEQERLAIKSCSSLSHCSTDRQKTPENPDSDKENSQNAHPAVDEKIVDHLSSRIAKCSL